MVTKTRIPLLTYADGNCAAGGTKIAPAQASAWKDVTGATGIEISYRVKNGSSAPGAAPQILVQTSPDNGTTVYDGPLYGGDTVSSSDNSNSIPIDTPIMYVRVIAYGNTTNPVGLGLDLLTSS